MSLLQRRIACCFIAAVGFTVVRGVVWHSYLSDHVDALARIERNQTALTSLETVLSTLGEAQTAERGYLITGNEKQLESYDTARAHLEQERARLSDELFESPTAQRGLDQLRPLVDASLAAMDDAIRVRRREGFAAAQRLVQGDGSERLKERLRDTARALGARERLALRDQLRGLSSRASLASGLALVGTVITIVILAGLYRLVAGPARRRESDLARENEVLDRLARIDPLTSLPNRRHLDRSLAESFAASVEHGSPLSLVVLDVDEFKRFNDTFGHPAGDETLRRVAAILRDTIREPDVAARFGGEEFAILLKGVDPDGAVSVAERLRAAIAGADWPLRPISASFGVATRDASTPNAARLVSLADRALYHSKSRGRNRVTHCRQLVGPALDTPKVVQAPSPGFDTASSWSEADCGRPSSSCL